TLRPTPTTAQPSPSSFARASTRMPPSILRFTRRSFGHLSRTSRANALERPRASAIPFRPFRPRKDDGDREGSRQRGPASPHATVPRGLPSRHDDRGPEVLALG